jgi:beta-phosphoglucomutase-like phosphatase (HAD superfamily)
VTAPDLVIFDCDGVLVDTETIANERLAQILTGHGVPTTMKQARRRFVGRSMSGVAAIVMAEDGIDLGDDFAERWYRELPGMFSAGVEAIPFVEDVIRMLRAIPVPLCVASSAKVEKMHMTLGATGLLPLLDDVLFSASMVANGKPAPDLFLHAARAMGHAPQCCAVIEDSPAGAMAGRAAGMTLFGYAGDPLTDADALAEAGALLFDDMRALPALLGLT